LPESCASLEQYGLALAWAGVSEDEGMELLALAARRWEAQRDREWEWFERYRREAEAAERQVRSAEACVMKWWSRLGWHEGAPDGSGPDFDLGSPSWDSLIEDGTARPRIVNGRWEA
jgi:hypothetical protein